MASRQQLKRRITSVSNTKQITKAMELVSASKMRRAQELALRSRDYRDLAMQLLTRLRELTDVTKHPLFTLRKNPKARLHIIITSNQGLAGAYDPRVIKQFVSEIAQDKKDGMKSYVITIGRQGSNFASKLKDVTSLGAYTEFPAHPTPNDIRPILGLVVQKFIDKEVDYVDVISTKFKSSLVQQLVVERLLPAAYTEVPISEELESADFEPSPKAVLESVVERLIEAQLNQAFVESSASEQSARMVAMKNATDNASDLIADLQLAFNTARQAAITQELAEITGGAEAIA